MEISHSQWPWLRSDATALAGYVNLMMMIIGKKNWNSMGIPCEWKWEWKRCGSETYGNCMEWKNHSGIQVCQNGLGLQRTPLSCGQTGRATDFTANCVTSHSACLSCCCCVECTSCLVMSFELRVITCGNFPRRKNKFGSKIRRDRQ